MNYVYPFHWVRASEQTEIILTNTNDDDDDEDWIWRDHIIIWEVRK